MNGPAISRRDFFRGSSPSPVTAAHRPPWVTDGALARCTSCADCVTSCPESILSLDAAGLPAVDFSQTGCTFCGDCAAACTHGVFADVAEPAWQVRLEISQACLLETGVACQLCTDFCDSSALQFDLSQRPVGALTVDQGICTGCGMCVGACPTSAISLDPLVTEGAA